jgi:TonB family protein
MPSDEPSAEPPILSIPETKKAEFTDLVPSVPDVRQPRRPQLPAVIASKGTPSDGLTKSPSSKVLALSAPRPEYPYQARRGKITGEGVATLIVDFASGNVIAVSMDQSTGSSLLDNSTIAALRRWRFKPRSVTTVKTPITYTLTGVQY